MLRDAWELAGDIGCDLWQLAVEIDDLRSAGLTNNDLRWMIENHLVQHSEEATTPEQRRRRFRRIHSLAITPRACFVLTEDGYRFASGSHHADMALVVRAAVNGAAHTRNEVDSPCACHSSKGTSLADAQFGAGPLPCWNARLHELSLGRQIVKRFTHPAPAQEMIFSAFEEEGWPAAIDDPLPAQFEQDPKRRLHYTVRNINRGQTPFRIRFFINGNGETVRWRIVPALRAASARRARRRR